MARVVEVTSYPVKGCAGTAMSEALLTEAGIEHDRTFMVIDENGVFRSQRGDPRLAVVRPGITPDGERLTLRALGAEVLRVDVDLTSERRPVELFGAPHQGIDQGEEAARWLTEVLGKPSRLVRVPPEHDRVTDGRTPGRCGYADSGAVHITSRSSIEALNQRLAGRGSRPLQMARFRPNVVVDGWEEPHREDRARRIGMGNAELGYAKLAIRCAVTTVDQQRGVKAGPEPLRTLADYRRAASGGVAFGAKFSVLRPGKLAVGDDVIVSSWGESEL